MPAWCAASNYLATQWSAYKNQTKKQKTAKTKAQGLRLFDKLSVSRPDLFRPCHAALPPTSRDEFMPV